MSCHKVYPNRDGSYKDSPDQIKIKKATINPINKKDNKYFQYAVTVALNSGEIKKAPQRRTKIKPFQINITGKELIFHQRKMIGKKLRKIM